MVARECLVRTLITIVGDKLANSQGLQPFQCRACGQYGHIARNCGQRRRQGAESPGRRDPGTNPRPKDALQVPSVADYSDRELEQELTRRKLDKEQQLADESTKTVNMVTGAVGSAYMLDVSVGGLVVSALVNPRRACARVTVVVLCVCVSVCVSVCSRSGCFSVR